MHERRLLNAVDQKLIWRRFAKAAKNTQSDPFSREIDARMAERLDYVRLDPKSILDLGSGPGESHPSLIQRYPSSQYFMLDAVFDQLPKPNADLPRWQKLLSQWQLTKNRSPIKNPICGDARALPFKSNSFDLIWSNQLIPWVDDVSGVFEEAFRVLNTDGLLMFSALGPATLKCLS